MEAAKLTREQAAALNSAIAPHLRYLGRLRRRMEEIGLVGTDPLYRSVCKAFDALQELSMAAHYQSCEGGVGQSSDGEG